MQKIVATFHQDTSRWVLSAEGAGSGHLLAAVVKSLGDRVTPHNGQTTAPSIAYAVGGELAETVNRVARELGIADWRTKFD